MATTVARLEAILSANTRDFDRAMGKSEGRMKKVGKAGLVMGGILGGALVVGLKQSVSEAIDAEKTQVRLEKAFKHAGKFGIEPYRNEIEKAGKAAIKLGFDDEELKDSLGSLIIATGSYKKAQNAANIAMDLARFKGVDLEQATKMLTMAMAGSQRAAKQLGLEVARSTVEADEAKRAYEDQKDAINRHFDSLGKLTPAQERQRDTMLEQAKAAYENERAAAKLIDKQKTSADVIDLVSQKVKGQADAYKNTTEGGIKVMQVQIENLKEQIGTALLPILDDVVAGLTGILEFFQKHPNLGKAVLVALTGYLVAATVAQVALNVAVLANPYVAAGVAIIAFTALVAGLWLKFKQLRDVIALALIPATGLLIPAILIVANHFEDVSRFVGNAWEKIKGFAEWIVNHRTWLSPLILPMEKAAEAIKKVVDGIKWLIDHIPDIPDLPDITPGFSIGDPRNPNFVPPGIQGPIPGSISPSLADELSGARSFGLTLTSGYRPGARTKHGTPSDHGVYPSKAIDVAGPSNRMASFFRWLVGQTDVKQAFYDPLGSIFGGVLSGYREGGHSDHVHVATYDRGGFLRPGWNLAYNGLGRPEPVGDMGPINLYVDGQKLFSWFRDAEQRHQRRNG